MNVHKTSEKGDLVAVQAALQQQSVAGGAAGLLSPRIEWTGRHCHSLRHVDMNQRRENNSSRNINNNTVFLLT